MRPVSYMRRAALAWMGCGLLSSAAAGACPEPVGLGALQEALGQAELALTEMDIEQLHGAMAEAEVLLGCLGEPISTPLAAEYHRFWGIRAFGERDPLARRAFAAARHLEPRYRFSESLIPSGNPILEEYQAIDLGSRATAPVPPPAEGRLLFDGRPGLQRPTDWPVVFQYIDPDGVQLTAYLHPHHPMPAYPLQVARHEGPALDERPGFAGEIRRPLLVGTATAAVATGILYGLALRGKARFMDVDHRPVPDEALPGLRARTHGLVIASAVTGAVAVGGGITLALTW